MKRSAIVFLGICAFYQSFCQPNFYERTYGTGRGVFIDKARNGNFIIGANTGTHPAYQAYYFLIDGNGDTLRTMSCPNTSLNCIRQSADGGFIFIGDSGDAVARTTRVFKSDSVGNIIWSNDYPSPDWGTWGASISPNYENGYFIGLVNDGDLSDNTYYILKADTLGQALDTNQVGSSAGFWQNPGSMCLTTDSGIIVVSTGALDEAIYLKKINSNNYTSWYKIYIDANFLIGYTGNCVIQTRNGEYVIVGSKDSMSVSYSPIFGYLMKTNLNGDSLWSRSFYFSGNYIRFISVVEDNNGQFYIAGEYRSKTNPNEYSVILLKTTFNGDTIWTKYFSGYGVATPNSMILDSAQNPMIIGYTKDTLSGQFYTYLIKTDTSGNIPLSTFQITNTENAINLYPNPVYSTLTIYHPGGNEVSFLLRTITGQVIVERKERNRKGNLISVVDLSTLCQGIYLLDISIDGVRTVKKVVKN